MFVVRKVLTPRHKDLEAGTWTQVHSSRYQTVPCGSNGGNRKLFTVIHKLGAEAWVPRHAAPRGGVHHD